MSLVSSFLVGRSVHESIGRLHVGNVVYLKWLLFKLYEVLKVGPPLQRPLLNDILGLKSEMNFVFQILKSC